MITVNRISSSQAVLECSETVSAEHAEEIFANILRSSCQKVVVDCSRLIHLDHRLLGRLYIFNIDLRVSKRKLILTGCSDKIRNLLHLTRVDRDMEVFKEPYLGICDSDGMV